MKSNRLLAILVFPVGFSSAVMAEDWTQFRGPRGDGVVRDAKFPEQWSETSNVVWKAPLPGRGWSQPIAAGGKIFVLWFLDTHRPDLQHIALGVTVKVISDLGPMQGPAPRNRTRNQ